MQKIPKQHSKNWFMKMFCCNVTADIELQRNKKKTNIVSVKKKGKIHLSLIGSTSLYSLCKMTRKNIAIDAFKFKGILPNPVNRYLSERIRGDIGLLKGELSSIVSRNITFPVKMYEYVDPTKPFTTTQTVMGSAQSYRKGMVDCCVYYPRTDSLASILKPSIDNDTKLAQQLNELSILCNRVIVLLPADIIMDQLGMLLASIPNKQIEIQSIMISGKCILQVVYIDESDLAKIRPEDKAEFVVRELSIGNEKQSQNIQILIRMLLQCISVSDIVRMLVESIGDAKTDTILTCFLRNVAVSGFISLDELDKLFKCASVVVSQTPNIALTGSFGMLTTRLSVRDEDLLNKGMESISHQYEIQTQYDQQFTLKWGHAEQLQQSTKM